MRFSDDEYAAVTAAASLEGLAVGAWVGEQAVTTGRDPAALLLRLHGDVMALRQADVPGEAVLRITALLDRIDAALDHLMRDR